MASINLVRGADTGLAERIHAFFVGLREARQRYRVYRETVRELNMLSDRDLNDLGLHRSTIDSIAIEAAYGK